MTQHWYKIADLGINITFAESIINSTELLPSLNNFECEHKPDADILFSLNVDDKLKPYAKADRTRIKVFNTGNGDIIVDTTADGHIQYIMKNADGRSCCLMRANKEFTSCQCALNGNFQMRMFGLNNALMIAMAFAGCRHDLLLIHASTIEYMGHGYAFIAPSGTGKSTQTSNWLNHVKGSQLLNDDNPIVRFIDDIPYIYGSPWSGKTPCYRDKRLPLGAITRIVQAPSNSVERLHPIEAFTEMLTSVSVMVWEKDIYRSVRATIAKLIERVPMYKLHCLPNKESALLCKETIIANDEQNN